MIIYNNIFNNKNKNKWYWTCNYFHERCHKGTELVYIYLLSLPEV
jgi:hypothetical protein